MEKQKCDKHDKELTKNKVCMTCVAETRADSAPGRGDGVYHGHPFFKKYGG